MSRQAVLRAFETLAEPALLALGFSGAKGHYVRRVSVGPPLGGLVQVIELQHSIYGGRVTANLGLDLECLGPPIRWITPPELGPHAHDAIRWIRIGMVRPERADCWWSFEPDSKDECFAAAKGCGRAILDHGVPWLEAESAEDAFFRYAEGRLERSKSPARPAGGYVDLRLMAVVSAWRGRRAEASLCVEAARLVWADERRRLVEARHAYAERHAEGRALTEVPDLQAELEALCDACGATDHLADGTGETKRPRRRPARRVAAEDELRAPAEPRPRSRAPVRPPRPRGPSDR